MDDNFRIHGASRLCGHNDSLCRQVHVHDEQQQSNMSKPCRDGGGGGINTDSRMRKKVKSYKIK